MLKRKNRIKILGAGSLCLFLLGCNEESFLQQDASKMVSKEVVMTQDSVAQKDDLQILVTEEFVNTQEKEADVQGQDYDRQEEKKEAEIVVHICGAVKQPGVYYLKEKQRLYEGIQKAGGFREDADEEYLNQAMVLEDGMKVVVPTKEETAAVKEQEFLINDAGVSKKEQNGKVDLNTADEAQLCTLPGIGESRAKSIIAYREEHGAFETIEDVMKVPGIKEAAFEKIKNEIVVSK